MSRARGLLRLRKSTGSRSATQGPGLFASLSKWWQKEKSKKKASRRRSAELGQFLKYSSNSGHKGRRNAQDRRLRSRSYHKHIRSQEIRVQKKLWQQEEQRQQEELAKLKEERALQQQMLLLRRRLRGVDVSEMFGPVMEPEDVDMHQEEEDVNMHQEEDVNMHQEEDTVSKPSSDLELVRTPENSHTMPPVLQRTLVPYGSSTSSIDHMFAQRRWWQRSFVLSGATNAQQEFYRTLERGWQFLRSLVQNPPTPPTTSTIRLTTEDGRTIAPYVPLESLLTQFGSRSRSRVRTSLWCRGGSPLTLIRRPSISIIPSIRRPYGTMPHRLKTRLSPTPTEMQHAKDALEQIANLSIIKSPTWDPEDPTISPVDTEGFRKDWRGVYETPVEHVLCVAHPTSIGQMKKVYKVCKQYVIGFVVQGGNTGLVGASIPPDNGLHIIVSTERMHTIKSSSRGKVISDAPACPLRYDKDRNIVMIEDLEHVDLALLHQALKEYCNSNGVFTGSIKLATGIYLDYTNRPLNLMSSTAGDLDFSVGAIEVAAGIILQNLNDALEVFDLEFPVKIGSSQSCNIGGIIATNAAGNEAAYHGTTSQRVYSVRVLLPNGTVRSFEGCGDLVRDREKLGLGHIVRPLSAEEMRAYEKSGCVKVKSPTGGHTFITMHTRPNMVVDNSRIVDPHNFFTGNGGMTGTICSAKLRPAKLEKRYVRFMFVPRSDEDRIKFVREIRKHFDISQYEFMGRHAVEMVSSQAISALWGEDEFLEAFDADLEDAARRYLENKNGQYCYMLELRPKDGDKKMQVGSAYASEEEVPRKVNMTARILDILMQSTGMPSIPDIEAAGENADEFMEDYMRTHRTKSAVISTFFPDDDTVIPKLRETIPEQARSKGKVVATDISFPVPMPETGSAYSSIKIDVVLFEIKEAINRLKDEYGYPIEFCFFGHKSMNAGHVNFIWTGDPKELTPEITEHILGTVYEIVRRNRGSCSAEHGVGVRKNARDVLKDMPPQVVDFMRSIVTTMNDGTMSPQQCEIFTELMPQMCIVR